MTEPIGAAVKAISPLTRMLQQSGNPLVAVKHGRREDRAAVYDRFTRVCLSFYRPNSYENDDSVEDVYVHELFAALHALELRAPRHVREAARRLFWGILGEPFAEGGQADEEPDYAGFWQQLGEDEETGSHQDSGSDRPASWYRPWVISSDPGPFRPPKGQRSKFPSGFEFLREVDRFTAVARVDVQNRWRWWHWPTAIVPPLRRWMVAR